MTNRNPDMVLLRITAELMYIWIQRVTQVSGKEKTTLMLQVSGAEQSFFCHM